MYQIEYRKAAAKTLARMPRALASKFLRAFEQLSANPARRNLDIKPLAGRDGYRLRIGDWRALYRVERDRLVIEVLNIETRGDVYK